MHAASHILALGPGILAQSDYAVVGLLILAAIGFALLNVAATHGLDRILKTGRRGPVKDSTYESGMIPAGDTRRRFNVRFYIVAMLFLLFDVEIVFFYPWAALFGRLQPVGKVDPTDPQWAAAMIHAGFGPGYFLSVMMVFIAILAVGYVYAWKKDVFRWD
jgi:NADH-quinone oxidoreductase subunit A